LSVSWVQQMTQIRYYPHTTSPTLCQPTKFTWLQKKKFAYQLHELIVSLTVSVIMPLQRSWPDAPSPCLQLSIQPHGQIYIPSAVNFHSWNSFSFCTNDATYILERLSVSPLTCLTTRHTSWSTEMRFVKISYPSMRTYRTSWW